METFIIEGKKFIIKDDDKSVINWSDYKKIILILILFFYFNRITEDGYNLIKYGLKFIVLLIIIQSFFKDSKVFNIVKKYINKITNLSSKILT